MGRFDDLTPDELRLQLLRFAEELQSLDREGTLLDSAPQILRDLGDLRARLFAFEVRAMERLRQPDPRPEPAPPAAADRPLDPAAEESDSQRIVEEAMRRIEEAQQEWTGGWSSEDETT